MNRELKTQLTEKKKDDCPIELCKTGNECTLFIDGFEFNDAPNNKKAYDLIMELIDELIGDDMFFIRAATGKQLFIDKAVKCSCYKKGVYDYYVNKNNLEQYVLISTSALWSCIYIYCECYDTKHIDKCYKIKIFFQELDGLRFHFCNTYFKNYQTEVENLLSRVKTCINA